MTRLVIGLLVAALAGAMFALVLAICAPEAGARQREAWQLGVCVDTPDGVVCGLHGAPHFDEGLCRTAAENYRQIIVKGRVHCTKVTVDDA